MTDKKTFGSFIKSKRIEKKYSQKELAELLYVTEGAISKWERGITYPDITMISDICRVLDISEHEFITSSTDTKAKELRKEAHQFRIIRGVWFWVPTISYLVALITCFICNIAVNHTLSWFFIVLSSLICAYTFMPTVTSFFKSRRLLVFSTTSYLSICLLLFTCSIYVNDLSWFLTSCIGVLMGYTLLFLPIILSKTKVSRYKFLISFTSLFILAIILLFSINAWNPFKLFPSILLTFYCFIPVILSMIICIFSWNGFFKAGICTILSTFIYFFVDYIVNMLFGLNENHYQVNLNNWSIDYISSNVFFICFLTFLFIGIIFILVGYFRNRKVK